MRHGVLAHDQTRNVCGGRTESLAACASDQEGAGVANLDARLLCYQVKLAPAAPPQAKHVSVPGIFVTGDFGRGRVDTLKDDELCVPSRTTLP